MLLKSSKAIVAVPQEGLSSAFVLRLFESVAGGTFFACSLSGINEERRRTVEDEIGRSHQREGAKYAGRKVPRPVLDK